MTTIPKEKDVFAFASRNYNFRYVPLFEYISLNPFHVMMVLAIVPSTRDQRPSRDDETSSTTTTTTLLNSVRSVAYRRRKRVLIIVWFKVD
jgi:hypothetical protein